MNQQYQYIEPAGIIIPLVQEMEPDTPDADRYQRKEVALVCSFGYK